MGSRTGNVLEPGLVDVEARHRQEPRSLSIPRSAVRRALVAGDLVKLWFVVDPPVGSVTVERMWVQVLEAEGAGYVGRLDNDPGYAQNLKADDRVRFGPEHVAARWADKADPLYLDPNGFAVVSSHVWADDAWPRRLERRKGVDPQSSGWFVFAGDESESFLADASNFRIVAHADLFSRFRVLDSGLEGPVGTKMQWDEQAVEFVKVGSQSG